MRDQLLDLDNQELIHLAPAKRTSTNWVVPKGERILGTDAVIQTRITYLDSSGRRWDRLNNREPQRIYGQPPSEAELKAFVAGMNNIDADH